MPTYEYACRDCGEHLEVVQSFKDDALTVCPNCEGELRKVFSAAGIIFKGSGWHIKDYASKGGSSTTSGPGASEGPSSSTGEGGSSSDSGSGSKGSGSEGSGAGGSGSEGSKGSGNSEGSGSSKGATGSSTPSEKSA